MGPSELEKAVVNERIEEVMFLASQITTQISQGLAQIEADRTALFNTYAERIFTPNKADSLSSREEMRHDPRMIQFNADYDALMRRLIQSQLVLSCLIRDYKAYKASEKTAHQLLSQLGFLKNNLSQGTLSYPDSDTLEDDFQILTIN